MNAGRERANVEQLTPAALACVGIQLIRRLRPNRHAHPDAGRAGSLISLPDASGGRQADQRE